MNSRSAVVVGSGIMGRDIAAIFLNAGWPTQVVAQTRAEWPNAAAHVAQSVAQLGGSLQEGLLQWRASLPSVDWDGVGIVVESVTENLAIKQQVFQQLDALVPPHVPIGSNSSGMRITDIASDCTTRHRMANAHFFLPAHLVPLVEVAKGEYTSDEAVSQLMRIFAAVNRVPVRVHRDVPGFLANRIQHALMREAFSVIDEGLASPEDVDAAVRFGFGFRYVAAGPILQKEFAGLDTQFAAASSIYPSLCNASAPSRILGDKVAAGRFGTKSGHGFWDWTDAQIAAERARYEHALLQAARLLTPALVPANAAVAAAHEGAE
ncbi:3-hydroxyacyl-CoA dehydrogenase family protein [Variovorax arabinosiphilus]|uniref:3-hydroxyacyl-CoA dehydrogenase family protein n=1 Tax=Variovorax arabinosiphilus TaxID=3053498 RepID=UPI002574A35E|nr:MULTISPECIES: 3-hydroxyacyl-CoA dehydrogenase NAD-binding domain-containing protein [unclassified Variovorax]MDM0123051.1 3-hydroxyacyl-CoA dehydrogenase NAD-binding domain-containing protein [Variovorax sp. J2L1-78]MDM0131953.1 3-hydroxyacyl-CoA dehydrogenase NAD-binding domain-containing protein [Variovorax sp. J2L1-63]MDM0235814.1 3-hydroxyacyl-CoA dehydrogenase NAD-binding domain-containing protein [Variovorax sp. J2R1-6]